MIKVLRIGHATFETPDLAKAVDHYTQVIGLLLAGRWRYGWRGRVALRWIIDQPGVSVVIPGARNPEQARSNAAAAQLPPLTDAEVPPKEQAIQTNPRRRA